MYLGKQKIAMEYGYATLLFMLSGFFLFIAVVGIFMYSSQIPGEEDRIALQGLKESLGVCVGMIVFFTPILIVGICKLKMVGKANKFNSLFENDPDGTVSVENAARLCGMTISKFVDVFSKLVRKGLLVNCSLDNPDNPVISLNNGADSADEKFDIVHCPSCGAPNKVKIGFVDECRYCGSKAISDIKK